MGRVKVSPDTTSMMSEMGATSSLAAMRGAKFFPSDEAGDRMAS